METDLSVLATVVELAFKAASTRQKPTMTPDLCPHILLVLDEQSCGAINQTRRVRHVLLSLALPLLSLRGAGVYSAFFSLFLPLEVLCSEVISSLNNFTSTAH